MWLSFGRCFSLVLENLSLNEFFLTFFLIKDILKLMAGSEAKEQIIEFEHPLEELLRPFAATDDSEIKQHISVAKNYPHQLARDLRVQATLFLCDAEKYPIIEEIQYIKDLKERPELELRDDFGGWALKELGMAKIRAFHRTVRALTHEGKPYEEDERENTIGKENMAKLEELIEKIVVVKSSEPTSGEIPGKASV